MSSGGSDKVEPCLCPAHSGQHCKGHNHQDNCLLMHVPAKHEAGPGAERECAEEGGERMGGEPEFGQGGQDCEKRDYGCSKGWYRWEDGVIDVLNKASSHTCRGNFHGQLAQSLAYHS